MKLTYYLLLIAALLLTACNNDEDEEKEFIMTTPPIGETFEGSETSITFESEDSVSIHILYPEERMKHPVGKSKYLFDNGKIQILSPHEPSFPSIEATETFVRSFEGRFTSNNIRSPFYNNIGACVLQYDGNRPLVSCQTSPIKDVFLSCSERENASTALSMTMPQKHKVTKMTYL